MNKKTNEEDRLKKAIKNEAEKSSAYDNAKISWYAPEYIQYEKGITWKILMGMLILGGAGAAIYMKEWTFALALVVFAVVYAIVYSGKPQNVEVKISNIGIKIGNRKYPFSEMKSFWIIYNPPYVKNLHFRTTSGIAPDVTVYLDDMDPAEIRDFLMEKTKEIKNKKESLTDSLLRLFKL